MERNNSSWATEGLQEAAYNGFTNGANNTTVSFITSPVVTPANYGDYSGRYHVVQVKITQLVPTLFMGALTGGTYSISAQAVAQIPPCIYLLNSKGAVTYTANEQNTGGPSYLYSDCPEYINGDAYSSSNNFHQAPETILTGASGTPSPWAPSRKAPFTTLLPSPTLWPPSPRPPSAAPATTPATPSPPGR